MFFFPLTQFLNLKICLNIERNIFKKLLHVKHGNQAIQEIH